MKVVSIINYKGGVGKTTLTACLASHLAMAGKRKILLVDMDAQCNLTHSFVPLDIWDQLRQRELPTLREWYEGLFGGNSPKDLEDLIRTPRLRKRSTSSGPLLSLIPSHLDLLGVDMDLASHITALDADKHRRRYVAVMGALRRQLRSLGERQEFDFALLDCPPNFNLVTQTAIIASDEILIPVRPNPLSAMGIAHLVRKRGELIETFNKNIRDLGDLNEDRANPKILGVVSMIWKVLIGDQAISGNAAVMAELSDYLKDRSEKEGRQLPVFKGFRHNETLFSKNGPFQAAWSGSPAGPFYDDVRESIHQGCREIGEALGVNEWQDGIGMDYVLPHSISSVKMPDIGEFDPAVSFGDV